MKTTIAATPSVQLVRHTADQALGLTRGITINFLTSRYGSIEAANAAARSFQTSFSGMRARERGTRSVGRYDSLACSKFPLANGGGVKIMLVPANMLLADMDIIDNATGEPVTEFAERRNDERLLMSRFSKMRYECKQAGTPFYDPLTYEEREEFYAVNAEFAVTMYADNSLPNPYGHKPDCPAPCFPYEHTLDPKLGYKPVRVLVYNADTDTDTSPSQPQRASDLALLIPDDADPFTYGVDGGGSQA